MRERRKACDISGVTIYFVVIEGVIEGFLMRWKGGGMERWRDGGLERWRGGEVEW